MGYRVAVASNSVNIWITIGPVRIDIAVPVVVVVIAPSLNKDPCTALM